MAFFIRWILFVGFFLNIIQTSQGGGTIEIKFEKYSHRCDEDGPIFGSNCDPMFTFCLDRPKTRYSINSCRYDKAGESRHYQNQKTVYFGKDIKGIPNPWIKRFRQLDEPTIMLVSMIRDDDTIGSNDHMTTMAMNLTQKVYSSSSKPGWARSSLMTLRKSHHVLNFRYRVYCDSDYYTQTCSVYCLPGVGSHFDCDPNTGKKVCHKGWQGAKCDIDTDECALGYCKNGASCTNTPGDYRCYCPQYITGRNCDQMLDPCDDKPCVNGGTCSRTPGTVEYTCQCVDGWEGENCERRTHPCDYAPCQNNGTCVSGADSLVYECQCPLQWKGKNCEKDVDECDLGYCVNSTTCENVAGDYICYCQKYFSGKNCTLMEDPCASQPGPCVNGGTCRSKPTSATTFHYDCDCGDGWEGKNCQDRINPCKPNPCLNGGSCITSTNSTKFECSCTTPYTGYICNETLPSGGTIGAQTDEQVTSNANLPIWAAVIICLVIGGIVVVVGFVLIRMRRKRRKNTQCNTGLPPSQTVVVYGSDNLAFENSMYTEVHVRNGVTPLANGNIPIVTKENGGIFGPVKPPRHGKPAPSPPTKSKLCDVPTTPSDDVLFNPIKPSQYDNTAACSAGMAFTNPMMECGNYESADTEGAVGGKSYDMEINGYVQPDKTTLKSCDMRQELCSPAQRNERAHSNPYADFNTLTDNKGVDIKPDAEEEHYQDLDEIAKTVKNLPALADDVDHADVTYDHDFDQPNVFDNVSSHYAEIPFNVPQNNNRYHSEWETFDVPPPPPPRNKESISSSSVERSSSGEDDADLRTSDGTYSLPRKTVTDYPPPPKCNPVEYSYPSDNPYTDVSDNRPLATEPDYDGAGEQGHENHEYSTLPEQVGYITPVNSPYTIDPFPVPEEARYASPPSSRPVSDNSEYVSPRSSFSSNVLDIAPEYLPSETQSSMIMFEEEDADFDDTTVLTSADFMSRPAEHVSENEGNRNRNASQQPTTESSKDVSISSFEEEIPQNKDDLQSQPSKLSNAFQKNPVLAQMSFGSEDDPSDNPYDIPTSSVYANSAPDLPRTSSENGEPQSLTFIESGYDVPSPLYIEEQGDSHT